MGDSRRFHELAEFIAHTFPAARFPAVADVAGGKGHLARKLAKRGYRPTVIDPISRCTGRGTSLLRQRFETGMARHYDLVVGLHPDAATEAIVDAARRRPVVLVPCCTFWSGPEVGPIVDRVRARWDSLGIDFREAVLPIQGRAVVLWTGGEA